MKFSFEKHLILIEISGNKRLIHTLPWDFFLTPDAKLPSKNLVLEG